MFADTHAHYDDAAFDGDREELLIDIHKTVDIIINPGCDAASSKKAAELARSHDFLYFAAGLHPEEADKAGHLWLDSVASLCADKKCVAVGEIGLDYYWDSSTKDLQKEVFRAQLELALSLNLPVIIHDREAHGDCLEIVKNYPGIRGVFHCFSGSAEMAAELLKCGFYLGFDGPVTYKNNKKSAEVLNLCPLDRILLETDSPYLSPVPKRGTRNDSSNLYFIAEKIAEIKQISPARIAEITTENAKACFRI